MEPRGQPHRVRPVGLGGEQVDPFQHLGQVRQVVVGPVRFGPAAEQRGAGTGHVVTRTDPPAELQPVHREVAHAAHAASSSGSGRACTTDRPDTARVSTT